MQEQKNEFINLYDEDGNELLFEHLDTLEMDGKIYVVLLEVPDDGQENDEAVIFRLEQNNGEDTLAVVEDDDELQAVFDAFTYRLENMDD